MPATLPASSQTPLEMVRQMTAELDDIYIDKFPDFNRYVRARILAAQWAQIRRHIEEDWVADPVGWDWREPSTPKPKWWTPTPAPVGGLRTQEGKLYQRVKYEDGFLYYLCGSS
jgi:hypothetical protein